MIVLRHIRFHAIFMHAARNLKLRLIVTFDSLALLYSLFFTLPNIKII